MEVFDWRSHAKVVKYRRGEPYMDMDCTSTCNPQDVNCRRNRPSVLFSRRSTNSVAARLGWLFFAGARCCVRDDVKLTIYHDKLPAPTKVCSG